MPILRTESNRPVGLDWNNWEQHRFVLSITKNIAHQGIQRAMKQSMLLLVFAISLPAAIQAQGAAHAGRGYTGIAVASDAFAGLWNPAALAFLPGKEVVLQPYLSSLSGDVEEIFAGLRYNLPRLGTFGGYFSYTDLGKQERTDPEGNHLGTFRSYAWTVTVSFVMQVTQKSAVGFNIERIYQYLAYLGGEEEPGGGRSDFAFDLGYYRKELFLTNLDLGLSIRNMGGEVEGYQNMMGGHVASTQSQYVYPRPVKFALGFKWRVVDREPGGLALYFDLNKILVASHPSVDFDGDGIIGGHDKAGNPDDGGEYSRDGEREYAHTDPWYLGLITSWYDDWLYGGDIDRNGDGIINADEEGNRDEGSLRDELRTITPHIGFEWRFLTHYVFRAGMTHDRIGKIREYTLGGGFHFRAFRIDLAYIPVREISTGNQMLISMNLAF